MRCFSALFESTDALKRRVTNENKKQFKSRVLAGIIASLIFAIKQCRLLKVYRDIPIPWKNLCQIAWDA